MPMRKETYERSIRHAVAVLGRPHGPSRNLLIKVAQAVKPRNRSLAIRILERENLKDSRVPMPQESRLRRWKQQSAEALSALAGYQTDEHGVYTRGDHILVRGLDFVPPFRANVAPYMDLGGEGLGLVKVYRTRVYAKSSRWRPSSVSSLFLVGRNEAGTYFSHPVHADCSSIVKALEWMWSGHSNQIIARQGDVALVRAVGPKLPLGGLPRGHRVEGEKIVHSTHPAIPLPGKGERVITAKRFSERAARAVRD